MLALECSGMFLDSSADLNEAEIVAEKKQINMVPKNRKIDEELASPTDKKIKEGLSCIVKCSNIRLNVNF